MAQLEEQARLGPRHGQILSLAALRTRGRQFRLWSLLDGRSAEGDLFWCACFQRRVMVPWIVLLLVAPSLMDATTANRSCAGGKVELVSRRENVRLRQSL